MKPSPLLPRLLIGLLAIGPVYFLSLGPMAFLSALFPSSALEESVRAYAQPALLFNEAIGRELPVIEWLVWWELRGVKAGGALRTNPGED